MAKKTLFAVIFALFYLTAQPAQPCFSPPDGMYGNAESIIKDADWIARVRPVSGKKNDGRHRIISVVVLEYLKGKGPRVIDIPGSTNRHFDPEPAEGNYYAHQTSQFWSFDGNYFNDTDCRIYPEFLFDKSEFLIFGPKQYALGYEQITSENDQWLTFVRDKLAGKKTKSFTKHDTATLALNGDVYLDDFSKAMGHLLRLMNGLSASVAKDATIDWQVNSLETGKNS